MSGFDDNPRIFRLPSALGSSEVAMGLLARVEALPPDRVLDLRITDHHMEVAWVTIYRSRDDVITASGPHGPYTTRGHTTWRWVAITPEPVESLNDREIERSEQIARSVLDGTVTTSA